MSNNSRTKLLILSSVIAGVLVSGFILRTMIVAGLEPLIQNTHRESAEGLIHRAGTFALVWSFLIALCVAVSAFFVWRKDGVADNHETASAVGAPEAAARFPEDSAPEAAAAAETAKGIPDQREKLNAIESTPEETTEEEPGEGDDDQLPISDPDRLKKIIMGLEELASAQTLGRALRKQQVELAPHLNDAVLKTRKALQDKEILFNLECENGLTMLADADCLTKIVSHLLDNAVKASMKGGQVTVSAAAHNGCVTIAVKDSGRGIKRKDLPHIFERFYRASGSGIGLGLAIVRELVDASGGTIDVETERGKGSTVSVHMPRT
ncbi:MAG TPA: HAMP domain-containing sensor histidine kinase [Nitrospirota bacterium]|nr:HAMP domain-containing sensor histidine kinase [Nitrospirota bacterium]